MKKGQTTPIEVANPAFLLERLAADCAPLQEYREITRNGIDAIIARCRLENRPIEGDVLWDVDWPVARDARVYKLCCVDTGIGMSAADIERYINHLSSSASEQTLGGNFGIGARITAGHKNPAGLMYFSWQDGEGVCSQFWRDDAAGVYGLKRLHGRNGAWSVCIPAPTETKPPEITARGTKVVLCGTEDAQHTVLPPEIPSQRTPAQGGMKWLTFYLNRRFFRFPDKINVRVRELSSKDSEKWPTSPAGSVTAGAQLRAVEGAQHHLDQNAEHHGTVDVEGATIWWWLLNKTTKSGKPLADSRESWETRGHTAALYQDELYEFRRLNDGARFLKMFGITFGFEHVVIYAEPHGVAGNVVTANTARSHLRLNGDDLPWVDWAAEFRAKMPQPLKKMMDDLLAASDTRDQMDAIKRRLQSIAEFLKVQRYRRAPKGSIRASGDAFGGDIGDQPERNNNPSCRPPGPKGGTRGNLYGALLDPEGDAAIEVTPRHREPDVVWASIANGLRSEGEMEDRAASYEPETNRLKINRDFRVFMALKQRFLEEVADAPGAETIVSEVVEEWIQQQLVEAIMGVRTALEGGQHWAHGSDELERALSEEALTVAVMPRYHVIAAVRRVLLSRLPRAKPKSTVNETEA